MNQAKVAHHFELELPSLLRPVLPDGLEARFARGLAMLSWLNNPSREPLVAVPLIAALVLAETLDDYAALVQRLLNVYSDAVRLAQPRSWPFMDEAGAGARLVAEADPAESRVEVALETERGRTVLGHLTWVSGSE